MGSRPSTDPTAWRGSQSPEQDTGRRDAVAHPLLLGADDRDDLLVDEDRVGGVVDFGLLVAQLRGDGLRRRPAAVRRSRSAGRSRSWAVKHPKLLASDRAQFAAAARLLPPARRQGLLVTPHALLRRHRELVRARRSGPGAEALGTFFGAGSCASEPRASSPVTSSRSKLRCCAATTCCPSSSFRPVACPWQGRPPTRTTGGHAAGPEPQPLRGARGRHAPDPRPRLEVRRRL